MRAAIFLLLLLVLVGCGQEQTVLEPMQQLEVPTDSLSIQGYGASWPYYSQGYRNTLLLSVGYQDLGKYGGACKIWVQNLVKRVTDGRVVVPANVTSTGALRYLWQNDPAGHVVGQCLDISSVQPGQVVQMAWGTSSLHTFLLAGRNSSGMYWLDSNWYKDGKVKYHFVANSWFNALPNLRYSVYTIGW